MKNKTLLSIMLVFVMVLSLSSLVYATDLNGVGTEVEEPTTNTEVTTEGTTTETTVIDETKEDVKATDKTKEEKAQDTANAVGNMFGETAIDEDSINQANAFIRPFASILNKVMAGILGLTALLMMLVTVLDLAYIALPFTRDMLDGGMQGTNQMQQGGSRGGMGGGRYGGMGGGRYGGMGGMGGMSGGMGGMGGMSGGMGGMGGNNRQQQQVGGGLSAVGRWVSDEAIAATLDTQGGAMGASTANGTVKTIIGSYMKKRAFFLIMFGVCVILFSSTVFTDLGIKLGTWLLSLLMGVGI